MNQVMMIGNLTEDPKTGTSAGGFARTTFRIAVTREYAQQGGARESDFFPVVCWRQTAENVAKYLRKGSKCAVRGSLQTRSYDAQDGTKRYVTEIVAERVEFLSRPPMGAETAREVDGDDPGELERQGFIPVGEDELPF